MFERFTDKARKAIVHGREEAERYSHNYLGPEHILLGLVRFQVNVIQQMILQPGLSPERIRQEVESHFGPQHRVTDRTAAKVRFGEMPFTGETKRSIECAVEEARLRGTPAIDARYLLVGLLRVEESIPAKVMKSLGVNLEETREKLGELVEQVERYRLGLLNQGGEVICELTLTNRDLASPARLAIELRNAIQASRLKEP